MPTDSPLSTVVSTKGQVILPMSIRRRRDWGAGTRLLVEETPDGVLLRLAPAFPPTRSEDVFAMLRRSAEAPVSIDEMNVAVLEEARRRHDRD